MDSTVTSTSLLGGALSRPRAVRPNGFEHFRKYASAFRTQTTVGGVPDTETKRIIYEVGRRFDTARDALRTSPDSVRRIESSWNTSALVADDFSAFARRYTNFSSSFARTNLAGVVERLSAGLAASSLYEDVDSNSLRGGAAISCYSLGSLAAPVSSYETSVFVPRLHDKVITPAVFAVLAAAVAGEGSSIVTDVLAIDANNNAPIVPSVDAGGFPQACVDALRVLGSNFLASSAGDQYALAFTRGLHRVLTVVGHTDEGGITRDVLRRGCYSPPFGGIHFGLPEYTGLPAMRDAGLHSVCGLVDGIALRTAAAVAHADPGTVLSGHWYPAFFDGTSTADRLLEPGMETDNEIAFSERNVRQIKRAYGSFATIYTSCLRTLFGFESGDSGATSHLTAFALDLPETCRHAAYPTITPFFWVEPTSLLSHDTFGTVAEQQGFAAMGRINGTVSIPLWESIDADKTATLNCSSYVVKFRSARTCGFLAHWLDNPSGGLSAITPRAMDPNCVVQPGGNTDPVRQRLVDGTGLDGYLWTRGQSSLPAPGEFLLTKPYMRILVRHYLVDDYGQPTDEHVPQAYEFEHSDVLLSVGVPFGIAPARANQMPRNVRRARTNAALELNNARNRAAIFGTVELEMAPVSFSAPVPGKPLEHPPPREADTGGVEPPPTRPAEHMVLAAAPAEPVPPVLHHNAHAGPRLPAQNPNAGNAGPGARGARAAGDPHQHEERRQVEMMGARPGPDLADGALPPPQLQAPEPPQPAAGANEAAEHQ